MEDFAGDDDEDDHALIELGDRQPQASGNDDELNQLENYFDNYS